MTAISVIDSTSLHYTDVQGTGLALHTMEQAAGPFDPSTGRSPVEVPDNWAAVAATGSVKAAPGRLGKLVCITAGTIELHDHATAASNSMFGAGLAMTAAQWIDFSCLTTAGLWAVVTSGKYLISYR